MERPATPLGTLVDAAIVTAICFGWFILTSVEAVQSDFPAEPFTDSAFVQIILLEAVFAAVALVYLRARGHDLRRLLPVPTSVGCLVGLGLYAATLFVGVVMAAAVGPAHPGTQPIEEMVDNASISIAPLVAMSVVNGLYEEVFLIGYLQRALESFGPAFAVGAVLLVRVMYHLYQGPSGTVFALGFGLVVGGYFLWARKLWPVVFAHMFADFAGFSLG